MGTLGQRIEIVTKRSIQDETRRPRTDRCASLHTTTQVLCEGVRECSQHVGYERKLDLALTLSLQYTVIAALSPIPLHTENTKLVVLTRM